MCPSLDDGKEAPYLLDAIERANLNHWTIYELYKHLYTGLSERQLENMQ
jgi:hypothetical protein